MADLDSGLPIRSEADGVDERVLTKIQDGADPGGVDKTAEVSEKLIHTRVHGENPSGTKTQLKLSETGALNTQGDYDASTNTKPSSSGLIAHDRNASVDETHQNKRVTAVAGADDTVCLDVAIRDESGASFSTANPLPVYIVNSNDKTDVYNNLKLDYNATLQVEYIGESPFATLDSENGHFIQKLVYDCALNVTRILLATSANENTSITNATISAPFVEGSYTFVTITANTGEFKDLEPVDENGSNPDGTKTESELTRITVNTSLGLDQTFTGTITEIISPTELKVRIDSGTPVAETTDVTRGDLITKLNGENSSLLSRRWDLREDYVYRVREDE